MEKPLVSVICLCYNHERFIREAVESVMNQSYPNIQVIIADDASTDGSVQEIHILKTKYPAIELLLLPTNLETAKHSTKRSSWQKVNTLSILRRMI
jgi:glycosyltransferase involved in cell wall biosynthesis